MHGVTAFLAVDGPRRHRSRYRRTAATAVCTVIIAAVLALSAGPALAHASFLGSDPGDGARLASAPAEISLEFSEDLQPEFVVVNLRVSGGDPMRLVTDVEGGRLVGRTPTEALQPDGRSREWRVDFRVVSKDGHPITGTSRFTVASVSVESSEESDPTSPAEQTSPTDRGQTPTPSPEATDAGDTAEQTPSGEIADSERGPAWLSTVVIGVITIVAVAAAITLISRGRTRPE